MISLIGKAVSIIRREGFSSFFSRFANYIKWLIGHCAVQVLWENAYGHFDKVNYNKYTLVDLPNESTFYSGESIKWIKDIGNPNARILLAGDNRKVAELLGKAVNVVNIYTTGIIEDVDFKWDFEDKIPEIGKFDVIVSQVMLEHLLNPYKHLCDLLSMLTQEGYLIIQTVCPGYPYHRYPVDTLRFYPDWFEEVGKKLKLTVIHRRVKNNNIFYMYQL
jgi:SAM-dependent methyltransferase